MLERPLADADARKGLDGVGGTAVDLDEHDQTLPRALRPLDPDLATAGQGHPYTQHLAGAEVAVEVDSLGQQLIE